MKLGVLTTITTLLLLLLLVLLSTPIHSQEQQTVIQTAHGPVKGIIETQDNYQVLSFYQIPFAQSPTGSLRFKGPQPLNSSSTWTLPLDCTSPLDTKMCVQTSLLGKVIGSEDCLFLDVYIPLSGLSPRPLPVMFWIFGGGYVIGDGLEFGLYDGKRLAHEKQVIVVSPNYRVNVFGFLALPELQLADEFGSTGNQGLRDQREALKWTQRNIGNFQGNPDRVTIFGESAGAFSVCWHYVSQLSKGLFSAAIMESGTCSAHEFFQPLAEAFSVGSEFALSVNCAQSLNGKIAEISLECLQSKKTGEITTSLLGMINSDWPFDDSIPRVSAPLSPIMPFGPPIDHSAHGLVDLPQNLLDSGQFNRVPMIMGTNQNEGSIFVVAVPLVVDNVTLPLSQESALKAAEHFFNSSAAEQSVEKYVPQNGNYNSVISQLLTDYFFACANRRAARAISKHGVDVYLYHFMYKLHFLEAAVLGDYHSSELDFVWDNPWPPVLHWFDSDDKKMADIFEHYWGNLAHSGNPNLDGVGLLDPKYVVWPRYEQFSDLNMVMDVPARVEAKLKQGVCDFWDTVQVKMEYR